MTMAAPVTLAFAVAAGFLAAAPTLPRDLSAAPQRSAMSVQSHRSAVLLERTFVRPEAAGLPVGAGSGALPRVVPPTRAIGEGEAFLSSLVVPGLAQYRQGQRRWIAYAGLEVLSAVLYLGARADALGLKDDYRDFAWSTARSGLSTEPRRDGDFEYYERLTQWMTSGRWDADPVLDGVQPESDPSTYNGSVWALATQIFNLDPAAPQQSPGYTRAMDYYRNNGYGPRFLWAWREGTGDRLRLSRLISRSDGRFKDARLALGVLAANHVVSAVDGFITARLRALPNTGGVGLTFSALVP